MFGATLESLRINRRSLAEEYSQACNIRDEAYNPVPPAWNTHAYRQSLEARVNEYAKAIDHLDTAIELLAANYGQ